MAQEQQGIAVYLEVGKQKTFAGALDWPGWCRSGRDEAAALDALLAYAPRYAAALGRARLGFRAPDEGAAFTVVERLTGTTTTDFGAPGLPPSADAEPLDEDELRRQQSILRACWRAFDAATDAAEGHTLRKGPRGGGRDREAIIDHVLAAEAGYLRSLGGQLPPGDDNDFADRAARSRQAVLDTLAAAARGEIAARGPRGGLRWSPRYAVRRMAWHLLDHAWEIEDRIEG